MEFQEIVHEIEQKLNANDKLSLIFLLFNDPELGLQYAKLLYTARICTPLKDWAHHPDVKNCLLKFQEALFITDCQEALSMLEANNSFIPKNHDLIFEIDNIRKTLYLICNELNEEECTKLVKLMDPEADTIHFGCLNLELFMLDWLCKGFITPLNTSKLNEALRKLDKIKLAVMLEEANSMRSATSARPSTNKVEEICHTDSKNMGLCIIINQKEFSKTAEIKLDVRTGTDVDRDRLEETFLMYGYKVEVWTNLTTTDLKAKLQELIKRIDESQEKHCSLLMCVLSHGRKDCFFGTDGNLIDIEGFKRYFAANNCKGLHGKPKIFFFQACQGEQFQVSAPLVSDFNDMAIDGPMEDLLPPLSYYAAFISTVPGYVSFRDKVKGSYFIEAVYTTFSNNDGEVKFPRDSCKIISASNKSVIDRNGRILSMTPEFRNSLPKAFYFKYLDTGLIESTKKRLQRFLFEQLLEEYLNDKLEEFIKTEESEEKNVDEADERECEIEDEEDESEDEEDESEDEEDESEDEEDESEDEQDN